MCGWRGEGNRDCVGKGDRGLEGDLCVWRGVGGWRVEGGRGRVYM